MGSQRVGMGKVPSWPGTCRKRLATDLRTEGGNKWEAGRLRGRAVGPGGSGTLVGVSEEEPGGPCADVGRGCRARP